MLPKDLRFNGFNCLSHYIALAIGICLFLTIGEATRTFAQESRKFLPMGNNWLEITAKDESAANSKQDVGNDEEKIAAFSGNIASDYLENSIVRSFDKILLANALDQDNGQPGQPGQNDATKNNPQNSNQNNKQNSKDATNLNPAPDAAKQNSGNAANPQNKNNGDTQLIPVVDIAITHGQDYKPLTGKQRFHLYLTQNFTDFGAYLRGIVPAIGDQLGNEPPEWGQGTKGFVQRYASNTGSALIQGTIQDSLSALLKYDPRYIQCPCKGFFHRTGHALLFQFFTYNNEGKTRLDISSITSFYASSMITILWYPHRYRILNDGFHNANKQIAYSAGFNVIEEFWPEIMRIIKRK